MVVFRPGRVEDEAVAEEADDVDDGAPDEPVVEAVVADEDCVLCAVLEVAGLEGDVEALAVVSESLGRVWAAASDTSRIETARRESEETDDRCRNRMLVSFRKLRDCCPSLLMLPNSSPLNAMPANRSWVDVQFSRSPPLLVFMRMRVEFE